MYNPSEFERLKNILTEAETNYSYLNDIHYINLRPKDLINWIRYIKSDLDFLSLLEISARKLTQDFSYEIVYVLFNLTSHQKLMLRLKLKQAEVLPSIKSYYANAELLELELARLYQLSFHGNIFKEEALAELPPLRINPNKSEEPYPEESWSWRKIPLLSSLTSGNFSTQICFDPEKVVDLKTQKNFYSRNVEKTLMATGVKNIGLLMDHLIGTTGPVASINWFKMMEDILKMKIPERSQAIRIILLEFSRVVEHLTVISEILISLSMDEFKLFIDAREKILELLEKYCGNRWGLNSVCLGGVNEDLPHGWVSEYQVVAKLVLKNLKSVHESLLTSRKFRTFLDVGGIDSQTILNWCITGPSMRSAGLNFDLRKTSPLYFYKDIDFDVPVGINGTAFDRYLIRFEEIIQSFRILTQVLDNLPLGDFKLPGLFSESEFSNVSSGDFWYYSSLESANGEFGSLIWLNSNFKVEQLKIKTPSIFLIQALREFLLGLRESELRPHLISLGIRRSELDR